MSRSSSTSSPPSKRRRSIILSMICAVTTCNATSYAATPADTNHQATSDRLQSLLPKDGYQTMARQKKHALGGMTTPKSELALYPYNLGPTGILAERDTKTLSFKVTSVAPGSPADGVVHPGDIITGANNRPFSEFDAPAASKARFPNVQMGMAIEESEQSKLGKLYLSISRNGSAQKVSIQLQLLGAFGPEFPLRSAKADYLISLNANILASRQLEDGKWGPGFTGGKKKGSVLTTCISALSLMATGESRYEPQIKKAYEAMLQAEVRGFRSWRYGYLAVFLGEYYLQHQDPKALAKLQSMCEEIANEGFYYNGIYGYGHNLNTGNYRYGGINACTAHACMAVAMAKVCGAPIPDGLDRKLARTLESLSPDGAMSYAWTGRSRGLIEQVKHNEHSGRTGMAAMAYHLLGGRSEHYQKMLAFLLTNSEYADCGHSSGGSLSWIWGSLAMGFDNQTEYLHHMRRRMWYFNFNRQWDGGFYLQPSAHLQFRPSDTILGPNFVMASNILLFSWNRHALLCTSNPKLLPRTRYQDQPALASSDYFERQDRIVEVAEAANLLKNNCPPSVSALLRSLQKLAIEDPEYADKLEAIYQSQLEKAFRDVDRCRASQRHKSAALVALLGINHSLSASGGAGKTGVNISHRMTPVNLGKLAITSVASSSDLKKDHTFRGEVTHTLTRDTKRLSQRFKLQQAKEKTRIKLDIQFLWKDISFGKTVDLNLPSEEIRGKWSRLPHETVYGPFTATVDMATPNGALRVTLPGKVPFECALMKNCLVKVGSKQEMSFEQYLKKHRSIPRGTKIQFSYFNRGSKIFLPMCDEIKLNH